VGRIRVVLTDDHPVVRQGVRRLLEGQSDLEVIAEESDGLETIELVARLKPDVLVLDLMLPGLSGLEVIRRLAKAEPATRILVLSMHANEAYAVEALRSGATGFAVKDASPEELVGAVRRVAAGRRYLSAALSERAIETYLEHAGVSPVDPYQTLTAREREVFQLAAEGWSNAQIADRLGISVRTAETHRMNLMRKLDIHNPMDLHRYALRRGIIADL
jgi:DNA-binding NarL/FixJ family response regulator